MQASVVVMCRLSRSMACGIFLGQGLNLYFLHCQADSLPLNHQESPPGFFFFSPIFNVFMKILNTNLVTYFKDMLLLIYIIMAYI